MYDAVLVASAEQRLASGYTSNGLDYWMALLGMTARVV